MDGVRIAVRRCYSLETELVIVAVVLLLWQAARIPLEASVSESLANAEPVLRLESALSLQIEPWVIGVVSTSSLAPVLGWLYTNVHLPVLFGFVAAARLLAPERYPFIRTIFVVSFVPALLVIGLFPLAPPYWLPEMGLGGPPSDAQLVAGGALFHNSTAAAASQHFGFAVLVAAASIWLFPRSWLAWWMLTYPVLVFVVIVGTGNHYVVDCVIGALTLALAAVAAIVVHGRPRRRSTPTQWGGTVGGLVVGYTLIVWGFVSLDVTGLRSWESELPYALVLAIGIALVLASRVVAREPVTEG